MATYGREQFVRRVLSNLRATDINETPEAEDATAVDEIAQQVFEGLYEEGLIPFNLDGEIPARYFIALRDIVTEAALPGYQFRDPAEVGILATIGRRRLWALRNPPFVPSPVQASYF